MLGTLRPLWAYRSFVLSSVKREFQLKYRNSLLGAAWTVLQPLSMIVVYTVIFSQVMRSKLPGVENTFGYSIHLCAGILTWGLFSDITSRAQTMFIDNANLIKKISFPRICLPIVVVINSLLNFCIVFGLFTAFLVITGNFPGLPYLAIFPLLLLVLVFAAGLGILLGILNVFFRDVGQFFGILMTFWFWLTPIVYSPVILPEWVRALMPLNPMAAYIGAMQDVLVRSNWPNWGSFFYPLLLSSLFCVAGLRMFRRRAGEMVDEL